MEAWISLTPQEQLKVLFHAVDERTSQRKESFDPLQQEPELTGKLAKKSLLSCYNDVYKSARTNP